ncbi:MAG: hypothetical protein NVV74_21455 [Magnetospirillum sp.]|nr:hypothetical protein [Magnetospirillum sp.]
MINAISTKTSGTANAGVASAPQSPLGGFDAALTAAQKAEEDRKQWASDLQSIKDKGFSAWARDTQIEALKEKLRQQVMSEMGIDEDSLGKLSSTMQEILEKKIQEEVDKRLQEEQAKTEGKDKDKVAGAQQVGKNDQDGKTVPVIPALSWPGAAALF